MTFRRSLLRLIAMLVLANIGIGFCDCLRDPIAVDGPQIVAATSSQTHGTESDCGVNCDSCVCCATLIVSQQASFAISLASVGFTQTFSIQISNPDLFLSTQPPRA